MENQNPQITDEEIRAIRSDCRRQAEAAYQKLGEVLAELTNGNHLGALGAFLGLDDEIHAVSVFLKRLARITKPGAINGHTERQ